MITGEDLLTLSYVHRWLVVDSLHLVGLVFDSTRTSPSRILWRLCVTRLKCPEITGRIILCLCLIRHRLDTTRTSLGRIAWNLYSAGPRFDNTRFSLGRITRYLLANNRYKMYYILIFLLIIVKENICVYTYILQFCYYIYFFN